jgi:hypothetical protein
VAPEKAYSVIALDLRFVDAHLQADGERIAASCEMGRSSSVGMRQSRSMATIPYWTVCCRYRLKRRTSAPPFAEHVQPISGGSMYGEIRHRSIGI